MANLQPTTADILSLKYELINEGCQIVEQPQGMFPRLVIKNPSPRLQEKAFQTVIQYQGKREEWCFCREKDVSLWWLA